MVPTKDEDIIAAAERLDEETEEAVPPEEPVTGFKSKWESVTGFFSKWRNLLDRETYPGSILFNLGAFILPALYSTLSKLWVANIDSSQVVTTDIYTYIGVIVEVLNEGIPRSVWVIIADESNRNLQSRLSLTYTLISFQILLGTLLMIIFLSSAEHLAAAFVPEVVRHASLTYVRISSVQALSSAMSTAVANSTRALDHPDVPLLISTVQFAVNILLDLLIISRFHVGSFTPTINTQALIRMACDLASAGCGLGYFFYIAWEMQRSSTSNSSTSLLETDSPSSPSTPESSPSHPASPLPSPPPKITLSALKTLFKPGKWTFLESALRNAIYLWLIHNIVSMGLDYATAWGIFNNIRWGIIMVPVNALEASTSTFVGHAWGAWRKRVGLETKKPKAEREDILKIIHPALLSSLLALLLEIPLCIFLSLWGIKSLSYYLSSSHTVAAITEHMWRTIDWCYIFYAVTTQLAAILLATIPKLYWVQSLGSNLLWMLPWAIAVSRIRMEAGNAWMFHGIIFGGALVFDFVNVAVVLGWWWWGLRRGRLGVGAVAVG
ncbi:hypothetical protein SBOR_6491 [Sclerotinia borealis F-4128]|uniref:Uncharacterized protein n=1 Tax=Sclerotinia borealis (strain F-4128) TaxID=1432307 RepID=W9CE88_SCLBF|nr:hypothetical protein SBOR_6491 [Sclerotinia borealis F-4128]